MGIGGNMKVREIIRKCAVLLDDKKLSDSINSGECTAQQQETIDLLLECMQLVNSRIAGDYLLLKDIKNIKTSTDILSLSKITNNNLYKVIKVKKNGYPISFRVMSGCLYAQSGNLEIEYAYLPEVVSIEDSIDYYSGKISERIFAYAIVSEYLSIKGNIDEAELWENKFRKAISFSLAKHKEIVIQPRRCS